jgi:hypothetical protein
MLLNNLIRNFFHCLLLTQMFALNAASARGVYAIPSSLAALLPPAMPLLQQPTLIRRTSSFLVGGLVRSLSSAHIDALPGRRKRHQSITP